MKDLLRVHLFGTKSSGISDFVRLYCVGGSNGYKETIGVDFYTRSVQLNHHQYTIFLYEYDLDNFHYEVLYGMYLKTAQGCIILFNPFDKNSLNPIGGWMKLIEENAGNIPLILVSNNLARDTLLRKKKLEEFKQFAQENGFTTYIDISTITTHNIDLLFESIVKLILNKT